MKYCGNLNIYYFLFAPLIPILVCLNFTYLQFVFIPLNEEFFIPYLEHATSQLGKLIAFMFSIINS